MSEAPVEMNGNNLHRATVSDVFYLTDSYKVTHYNQYPPGTTHVYSYFESRGGKFDDVCFFGLQYIMKRWLVGEVVNKEKIEEAREFFRLHFGRDLFNYEGWTYIAEVPWIVGWFETVLVQCWYPTTVCTLSRAHKKVIGKYLSSTADNQLGLEFKLHDFGYRGCSTVESAAVGACAHLVNFQGTDTVAGLRCAMKYYGSAMAGHSIPAAEHSTITAWGPAGEREAFANILQKYPDGVVSVVSDSYDVFTTVDKIWGDQLKGMVVERGERGGVLVIRPDSGNPSEVVVKLLELLGKKFGTTTNSKGFKELPPYLRMIQGDGITYESVTEILESIKNAGWSADNLAFGTGGALLQRIHRDTQKCAFKCSAIEVNGATRDVFKDPVTDPGKRSKKGRLTLERNEHGRFVTVEEGKGDPEKDCLEVVYENGSLIREWTLDEIRKRARENLFD